MTHLVISCSLNPESKSRILALECVGILKKNNHAVEYADMRDYPLPLCDGDASYDDKTVKKITKIIQKAHGVILAVPIYNYGTNAVAKNLIELTGSTAWNEKVVGFLCQAGGQRSYMSVMGTANSLMLDFRCTIVPRFVYSTDAAFEGKTLTSNDVKKRLNKFTSMFVQVTKKLNG